MNRHASTSDVETILRTLRALGTGGALGGAAAIGVYVLIPAVSATGLSLHLVAAAGAAAGTALHRTLAPLVSCISHYRQLVEIQVETRLGLMSADLAARLRTELQVRYFLGAGSTGGVARLIIVTIARIRERRCASPPGDALRPTARERRSRRSTGCRS
jgi:hypothetical protein